MRKIVMNQRRRNWASARVRVVKRMESKPQTMTFDRREVNVAYPAYSAGKGVLPETKGKLT